MAINYRKTKKKNTRAQVIKECDRLWSLAVRQRDGKCLYPGCNKDNLQAHHIFSRRNMSTRFDIENGACICMGHHLYGAHQNYEEFRDMVIEEIGKKGFERLKAKANLTQKWSLPELIEIKHQLNRLIDK